MIIAIPLLLFGGIYSSLISVFKNLAFTRLRTGMKNIICFK